MTEINKNRRNFLKIVLIGGGVLAVSRILGPKVLDLFYGPPAVKDFERFNVKETRTKFSVLSKEGEEIFIMDSEK